MPTFNTTPRLSIYNGFTKDAPDTELAKLQAELDLVMEKPGSNSEDEIIDNLDDEDTEDPSIGQIISVKDGVAFVTGLDNIQVGEMVEFMVKA